MQCSMTYDDLSYNAYSIIPHSHLYIWESIALKQTSRKMQTWKGLQCSNRNLHLPSCSHCHPYYSTHTQLHAEIHLLSCWKYLKYNKTEAQNTHPQLYLTDFQWGCFETVFILSVQITEFSKNTNAIFQLLPTVLKHIRKGYWNLHLRVLHHRTGCFQLCFQRLPDSLAFKCYMHLDI